MASFRVFQEALTNAAVHAQAANLIVSMTERPPNLCLEISDDGRGIEPHQAESRASLGIVGMRERADAVGGTLTVERNSTGRGTTVRLIIPIQERPR
jgi:signal transduction histidine kinase